MARKYEVVWTHKTAERTTMESYADYKTVPKPGKENYVRNTLWPQAGKLMIACSLRTTTTRVSAIILPRPALGQPFVPMKPLVGDREQVEKAWCVWFNSTPGIIGFLNNRDKILTYPNYSLEQLRDMPKPNPLECDLAPLAEAYDAHKNSELTRWRDMADCPVRGALDRAAAQVIGKSEDEVADWRLRVSREPTVCNREYGT